MDGSRGPLGHRATAQLIETTQVGEVLVAALGELVAVGNEAREKSIPTDPIPAERGHGSNGNRRGRAAALDAGGAGALRACTPKPPHVDAGSKRPSATARHSCGC